jgi:F-type H+-transporting ATPase subunit delta
MANLSSIARPYALAAFDYAREHQQLSAWKAFLTNASLVARDPAVAKLLANHALSAAKLYDLFHDVLKTQLNTEQNNFLLLISQRMRFAALPEITDAFNAYYAALEKLSNVRVVTAVDIQDEFRQKLSKALTKRIQRDVTLHCETDPAIIGGAIIHIGDRVIDGSVRGKLSRLLQNLTG